MENNECLVLEDGTENAEELTAEETEQPKAKIYTEEEMLQRVHEKVDELLPKKLERRTARIRKEFDEQYSPYRETEAILKAGLGVDNIREANESLRSFYEGKGYDIPKEQVAAYNDDDLNVLAQNEATRIIEGGFDEVVEEINRLAVKGVERMTPREKLVFSSLSEYRKAESDKQELLSIGIKGHVLDSKDFKDFRKQFNADVPIKEVYKLYAKTTNPSVEPIGSMKNGNHDEVKTYYSPEDVDKLTEKDLEDPVVFQNVRRSMLTWK